MSTCLHPLETWHDRYLALVRGRSVGWMPWLLRGMLWVASWGYGLAVRFRNQAFDRGWKKVHRASVPVVSVGNLTTGGTGKTPMVEFISRLLRQRDSQVALLSRGYGSEAGRNDEALVLEENLPDVPHLQGVDRVALAQTAVEELESEILVLDDGFQHRRLGRDLDVVLLDATDPWGGGYLLPRGLLREPRSSLRRADAIVLTRCDQVEAATLTQLRAEIARVAPAVPQAEATHSPRDLVNSSGTQKPVELIRERPVAGFCGIGNPEAFRRTLQDLGGRVIEFRAYPDHHAYSREDVETLCERARHLPEDALVVTTQKDLVKIRLDHLAGRPLWAVRIGMEFRSGQDVLERLVESVAGA
ncbi:MAG: tetraacyldisaccharide 4'-kinase [Gemmataceae bacterium]